MILKGIGEEATRIMFLIVILKVFILSCTISGILGCCRITTIPVCKSGQKIIRIPYNALGCPLICYNWFCVTDPAVTATVTTATVATTFLTTTSTQPATTSTLPPTTSTLPPTTSTLPPTTSTLLLTTSTLPPTTSTLPPTTSTLPPTTSTLPPTTSTLPPTTSTLPPTTSTLLLTTSTLPPTTSTLPPTTSTLPPTTSTLPPTTSTLPPTTSTLPPTTSTLPATTSTPPPTTSTLQPTTSTLPLTTPTVPSTTLTTPQTTSTLPTTKSTVQPTTKTSTLLTTTQSKSTQKPKTATTIKVTKASTTVTTTIKKQTPQQTTAKVTPETQTTQPLTSSQTSTTVTKLTTQNGTSTKEQTKNTTTLKPTEATPASPKKVTTEALPVTTANPSTVHTADPRTGETTHSKSSTKTLSTSSKDAMTTISPRTTTNAICKQRCWKHKYLKCDTSKRKIISLIIDDGLCKCKMFRCVPKDTCLIAKKRLLKHGQYHVSPDCQNVCQCNHGQLICVSLCGKPPECKAWKPPQELIDVTRKCSCEQTQCQGTRTKSPFMYLYIGIAIACFLVLVFITFGVYKCRSTHSYFWRKKDQESRRKLRSKRISRACSWMKTRSLPKTPTHDEEAASESEHPIVCVHRDIFPCNAAATRAQGRQISKKLNLYEPSPPLSTKMNHQNSNNFNGKAGKESEIFYAKPGSVVRRNSIELTQMTSSESIGSDEEEFCGKDRSYSQLSYATSEISNYQCLDLSLLDHCSKIDEQKTTVKDGSKSCDGEKIPDYQTLESPTYQSISLYHQGDEGEYLKAVDSCGEYQKPVDESNEEYQDMNNGYCDPANMSYKFSKQFDFLNYSSPSSPPGKPFGPAGKGSVGEGDYVDSFYVQPQDVGSFYQKHYEIASIGDYQNDYVDSYLDLTTDDDEL